MRCNLVLESSETTVNHSWPFYGINRPYAMIYYVVDGFAHYEIGGQSYEFQPNHIYFFPSNTTLSLINDISPNFKIMYIHTILTPELTTLIEVDVGEDKFFGDLINLMRKNVRATDTTYIRLLSDLLVSYVSEKYILSTSSICNEIRKYIQENYVAVYRDSDLSRVFNYSNSHILKIYKDTFNTTPRHHALSFMLENIINRLKSGEAIYKISDSLDFSSPENFSKFFKKHLGVSPSHFKKFNSFNSSRTINGTNT